MEDSTTLSSDGTFWDARALSSVTGSNRSTSLPSLLVPGGSILSTSRPVDLKSRDEDPDPVGSVDFGPPDHYFIPAYILLYQNVQGLEIKHIII